MRDVVEHKSGFSILRCILSAAIGFIFCCILLLIGAVFIENGLLPEQGIEVTCWSLVTFSAFLAAFCAAGKNGRRMMRSLCASLLFFVFAMLCGELLGGAVDAQRTILMGAILLIASVLGAVISGLIWE